MVAKRFEQSVPYKIMKIRSFILEQVKQNFTLPTITYGNFVCLLLIYQYSGLTQKELGVYLNRDKNIITRVVDKLEGLGYIRREKGEDRRSYALKITELGKTVVEEHYDDFLAFEKELTMGLSPDEFKQFHDLLDRVITTYGSEHPNKIGKRLK